MAKKSYSTDSSETTQTKNNSFRLIGRITDRQTGQDLSGLHIEAFDDELPTALSLGGAHANEQGHYEITYSHDQSVQAEKSGPNLFIRVFDAEGWMWGEILYFIGGLKRVIN